MLLRSLSVSKREFEVGTGWTLKPEGACKGAICVPLSKPAGDVVDVQALANDMQLPLISDGGWWALGPSAVGARALTTAEAPDLRLPDVSGNEFRLSSLRGQKVLLYAWAPY